jgi:hypothetical protein
MNKKTLLHIEKIKDLSYGAQRSIRVSDIDRKEFISYLNENGYTYEPLYKGSRTLLVSKNKPL